MYSELISLFVGSLLASTLVPGGVEVLLYYLLQSGENSVTALLIVATIGNTLGGVITFVMGAVIHRGFAEFAWLERIQRFFKLEDEALVRVKRWGIPALFFSWMPVVGDPICLAAGFLRLPLWPSVLMIFISKFVRYAVLLWIFSQPWATVPSG